MSAAFTDLRPFHMQEHNSKGEQTHSLAINRFADWHREEFLATMLPNHGKPRPALPLEGKQALMHKSKVPEHMLPTTVDWRGSGADSPVKDQASCGSCWVSCSSSSCFSWAQLMCLHVGSLLPVLLLFFVNCKCCFSYLRVLCLMSNEQASCGSC